MARGIKTGGRKLGGKNKKTIERELVAQAASEQPSPRAAAKLGKEVMSEVMMYFMGLAAKYSPGTKERPNPDYDAKKLDSYLRAAGDMAAKLAPYQSPRLESVTMREETQDLSRLTDGELAAYLELARKASVGSGVGSGANQTQH